MIKTIDMKVMRYINLFAKVSRVSPKHCLNYNNAVIFVVPGSKVSEAIGDNGKNIKKMSEIIGKKVKVVMEPKDISDAEKFISTIIYPVEMNGVEVENDMLIINAGPQSKAMLIGRNKVRLEEMKKIVKEYFGKELKIV